jgi:hypothetical protein
MNPKLWGWLRQQENTKSAIRHLRTDKTFMLFLVWMNVELFRQYFYPLSFLEGFQANLPFEGRSESSTGCLAHF